MDKNNSLKILGFIVLGGLVITAAFFAFNQKTPASANLDVFAQCLADQGATMYGAEWCVYCKQEKKNFGDSFRLVPYVECPDNPALCTEKKIEKTPTWLFPDGRRFVGLQGLQKLSEESGCPLP